MCKTFGTQIFYMADNLKTVYYNSDFSAGENNQILNTDSIEKVVFGGTIVPNSVCYSCVNLSEVIILDSVISIKECAFTNCKKMTCITIGKGVKTIGAFANVSEHSPFSGCVGLTRVNYTGRISDWCTITFDYIY